MIEQIVIAICGIASVFLSQDPRHEYFPFSEESC